MKVQIIEFNSEPETQEARNGVYVFDGKVWRFRSLCFRRSNHY